MPGSRDYHVEKKISYFRTKAATCQLVNETLFLRHVNSCWVTLTPALQRVLERWEDERNYFLVFLANDKKKKKDLAKTGRRSRIVKALKDHKKVSMNY